MNFKLKFLKYKKKYDKLIAGMLVDIDETIEDEINNCDYKDITTEPMQDKKLNEADYSLALQTLIQINLNEYDILFIHLGGKNSAHKLTDLPIINNIHNIHDKFKILILIIDIFEPDIDEFSSDNFQINNNVFIQNLNIGLGINPECNLYKILNEIIEKILDRKGLVVIVNSMLFITKQKQISHDYFV